MELALEAAPVGNFQQKIGICGGLLVHPRQCLRQLGPQVANGRFGAVGRGPFECRRGFGPGCGFGPGAPRGCNLARLAAILAAFGRTRSREPGFLRHDRSERLAAIYQDRIVHSGPLATLAEPWADPIIRPMLLDSRKELTA